MNPHHLYDAAASSSLDPVIFAGPSTYADPIGGDNDNNNNSDNTKRPRTGCLTCRLRKKRCDERKPSCATCDRLGIECLGYDKNRPSWLRTDESKKQAKQDLKKQIRINRTNKARAAREGSDSVQGPPLTSDQLGMIPPGTGTGSGGTTSTNGVAPINSTQMDHQNYNNQNHGFSFDVPQTHMQTQSQVHTQTNTQPTQPNYPNITQYYPAGANPSNQGHTQNLDMAGQSNLTNLSAGLNTNTTSNTTTDLITTFPSFPDTGFEDVWSLIFGQPPGPPGLPAQPYLPPPSPTADNSLLSFFSPPASTAGSPQPDLTYLHHYLNVVLPLQYRFVVKAIADLVAPLALNNAEILKSTSTLAALHLAAQRAKDRPSLPWSPERLDDDNVDQTFAMTAHRQTLDKIRFASAEDLTSEEVILPTLFAMSYYLFLGGTSRDWPDVLATSRRCLSAALSASPELPTGLALSNVRTTSTSSSPWKRYRPLINGLVWMDIVGSVTQNKASRLLPVYRSLLGQPPAAYGTEKRTKLHMERVMGCDDTTFLAIAETVQLSEWRDAAEDAGCLSLKELLHRAALVEKILDERTWREDTLGGAEIVDDVEGKTEPDAAIIPVMAEIFYGAAKVLLASVVHGPHPRVPEIAGAVQETAEALHRLDIQYPVTDVNRSLIFPITIAGVHAESPAQQTFFRNRFATLGPEAAAFGNSKQALQLLEEVWKKRNERGKSAKVCWRQTMRDLGWESGILLI